MKADSHPHLPTRGQSRAWTAKPVLSVLVRQQSTARTETRPSLGGPRAFLCVDPQAASGFAPLATPVGWTFFEPSAAITSLLSQALCVCCCLCQDRENTYFSSWFPVPQRSPVAWSLLSRACSCEPLRQFPSSFSRLQSCRPAAYVPCESTEHRGVPSFPFPLSCCIPLAPTAFAHRGPDAHMLMGGRRKE